MIPAAAGRNLIHPSSVQHTVELLRATVVDPADVSPLDSGVSVGPKVVHADAGCRSAALLSMMGGRATVTVGDADELRRR